MQKTKLAAAFVLLTCFATAALADDAVVEVMKLRAFYQRIADNDFLIFGDKMSKPEGCYQAAISNYVEDKWAGFAKSFGCANDDVLCDKGPKATEDLDANLKLYGGDVNSEDYRKSVIKLQNNWYLSASMYKLLRKLRYAFDPADDMNSFSNQRENAVEIEKKAQPMTREEKQQIVDELHRYIDGCDTMKPVAWTMPENAMPEDDRLTGVSMRAGIIGLLTSYFVTQQVPGVDKGYIGCIFAWNAAERSRDQCKDKSCADIVPADDKAALTAKMEELKAHQCSLTYALQMIPPADGAQPVKP